MSINIVTKDSDGNQFHPASIYTLNFSYIIGAGCERAEILLPNEKDIPVQLDDLRIYDGIELLWLGRIEDEPLVTQSGEVLITAVGYASSLKDELVQKLWVDTGFKDWSETPASVPNDEWEWQHAETDNNNRIFVRLPRDQSFNNQLATGRYYRLTNPDKINQDIYSVSFNYSVGAAYNPAVALAKLNSYDSNFTNAVQEWSVASTGPLSASTDFVVTAGKKAMGVFFDGAVSATPADDNNWVKITNIRVNGSSDFTGTLTADALIKDIIPDFAPSLSTDFSDITTGTGTITDFLAEDPTHPLELISNAISGEDWKTGIYEVGSDNKPRYRAQDISRDTIDWFVSVDDGQLQLAGKSIQEVFNAVEVEFLTATGSVTTVTRTTTVALLDDAGITRTAKIQVNTTSQTAAEEAGDQFLTEFGRPRAKGQMTLKGSILSKFGNRPAWFIRPNDILQIHDLNPSPATLEDMSEAVVTNGINIFEVVAVDVNISGSEESITIQLETPASRLDFELAKI